MRRAAKSSWYGQAGWRRRDGVLDGRRWVWRWARGFAGSDHEGGFPVIGQTLFGDMGNTWPKSGRSVMCPYQGRVSGDRS